MKTLITGAFARLPGRQVLEVLPARASLLLVPEPENPYDSEAIRVEIDSAEIPHASHRELTDRLEGTGWSLADVLQNGEAIHLGYVAASNGKPLLRAGLAVGNREFNDAANRRQLTAPYSGKLCFAADGAPMVELQLPAAPSEEEEI